MHLMAEQNHPNDQEFETLLNENRHRLHGFALAMVGNRWDADDLLQSTYVVLWEKRQQFEHGTNFLAWARKILRFHVLNHWRREKIRQHQPLLDDHLEAAVTERMEERELEFTRHRKALQHCLQSLPDRQRQAISAHYFEEKSIPEVSEKIGLKPNALSQLLFRARTSLMACMQTHSQATPQ